MNFTNIYLYNKSKDMTYTMKKDLCIYIIFEYYIYYKYTN